MKEIILASASPRRNELLKQIGLQIQVLPSTIEETIDSDLCPEKLVMSLSSMKAHDIAAKSNKNCIIIGADTIVVCGKILGKPQNEDDAFNMLDSLQGKWHEVITGITVIDNNSNNCITDFEKTRVKMRELTNDEISTYIRTGEPLDKAGAYGIQGIGAVLVEKIDGCYFNVVGLPLAKLCIILKKFEISIL